MQLYSNGYGQNRLNINEAMTVGLVNKTSSQIVNNLTDITAGFYVLQQGGKRTPFP
jgi:hypothetical protein